MRVVTIGAQPEVIQLLVDSGHEITMLYEDWEETRAAIWRDKVARWCAVDSYTIVESLWSALHHVGALATDVDAVVTTEEYAVVPAGILGRQLGAAAVNPDVALRCRDKAVQKASWRAHGIPTAGFAVLRDVLARPGDTPSLVAAAGLCPPFIIKPTAAAGASSVAAAADLPGVAAEADRIARANPALRRLMVEEYVEGPEWHFDGVVRHERIEALLVSRYVNPLIGLKHGHPVGTVSFPPDAARELYEAARNLTGRALGALELTDSVFHFEVFGQPSAFVAGELAARPGGGMVKSLAQEMLGVDLMTASVRLLLGQPVPRATRPVEFFYGYTHLPTAVGRVNRVLARDIERVHGVIRVVMKFGPGEVMPDMAANSFTRLGLALVRGHDLAECERTIAAVVRRVTEINAE